MTSGALIVSIVSVIIIVIMSSSTATATATATAAATATSGGLSLIVAGSTGAIGRHVVAQAVKDPAYSRVVALSRRALAPDAYAATFPGIDAALAAQKLAVVAIDWEALWVAQQQSAEAGDAVAAAGGDAFKNHTHAAMCMGTTKKDAGSAEAFKHVDLDYVVAFAKQMQRGSGATLQHFSQISSQGADASSWFLYMETKGQADEAVARMQFKRVSIFRPGLLDRGEDKERTGEKVLRWFIGAMPTAKVALALVRDQVAAMAPSSVVAAAAAVGATRFFSNGEIYAMTEDGTATP